MRVDDIAADAEASLAARLRAPRLASLETDILALLDREELTIDPIGRYTLELMLHGIRTLIEGGQRDAFADEDMALRAQMKEIADADFRA